MCSRNKFSYKWRPSLYRFKPIFHTQNLQLHNKDLRTSVHGGEEKPTESWQVFYDKLHIRHYVMHQIGRYFNLRRYHQCFHIILITIKYFESSYENMMINFYKLLFFFWNVSKHRFVALYTCIGRLFLMS